MPENLPYILQLLDDPDASVQAAVQEYLYRYNGDLSNELAALNASLSAAELDLLSRYSMPCRWEQLHNNWQVPTSFIQNPHSYDWETFEFLLSLLSDYLHDGVSIRPRLTDALDMLADEANLKNATGSIDDLAKFLFTSRRFTGNNQEYFSSQNSDLSWVLESSIGSPISLVTIFMLVSRRLGLEVYGCNYPGHFLAWIEQGTESYLVDPYNRARKLSSSEILSKNPNISPKARAALLAPCSLPDMMIRILNNLEKAFQKSDRHEEISQLERLKHSLSPSAVKPKE